MSSVPPNSLGIVGSKKRKLTGADLINAKVKKKCCKSRPRCRGCPVVVSRLAKAGAGDLRGND
jgi:hypothetical protein